jgi:hypothetical protein
MHVLVLPSWHPTPERPWVKTCVDRFGMPDVLHAHVALWVGTLGIRMRRALAVGGGHRA